MSEDKIAQSLQRLFERYRIVFWYDAKQELRDSFDALQLTGIEKIELVNNEFSVKHRLLREQSAISNTFAELYDEDVKRALR